MKIKIIAFMIAIGITALMIAMSILIHHCKTGSW
jgi:hypothetical protein